MTARITTTWNPESNTSETKTTYSQDWNGLSNLEKADHLKDVIDELTDVYNAILEDGIVPMLEKRGV